MSIYTCYDETLDLMKELDSAIENNLKVEDPSFDDALEESLSKSAAAISEEYGEQASKIYGSFNAALRKKDFNKAQAELTNLENVVRQWNAKLKELPPENVGKTVVKNTIKVILVIAGIALAMFGPYGLAKIAPTILQKLIGRGLPAALWGRGGITGAAITIGGEFALSLAGVKLYMQNLTTLLTDHANKKIFNQKHPGANDPNAHNGKYVAEVLVTDQWLKTIAKCKKKLLEKQSGK